MSLLTLADYEALARERLPREYYDYYAGGAGDEVTIAANRRAFEAIALHPRVLVNVAHVDTSARVLGADLSLPVLLAPTAFNRLAHPEGEEAAARGAARAGTVMVASTFSTCTAEAIAAAATGPLWMQVYIFKDRAVTSDLIARVEAAGYRAIVLTVDTPVLGRRDRDVRNAFTLPEGMTLRNFESPGAQARWKSSGKPFAAWVHDLVDPSLTWDDVEWLRARTRLPIVLKGLLSPADAHLAARAGVDGIIVSNHGGRQLDGAPAAVTVLPSIADAVAGRTAVLMDGGVRRGSDVLKALALGADAVLVGRAYLWGLAVAGEDGVADVLRMLREELAVAMALIGRPSVAAIDRTVVDPDGRPRAAV